MSMRKKAALAAQQQRLEDFRSLGLPDPPDEENGPMPMDYRQVDAILDAMREPSDQVLLAGYIARFGEVEANSQVVIIGVRHDWQAMIDAIKSGK